MRYALLVGAFVVCVAGCRKDITEGEIVAKRHEPENSWVQMIPMQVYNGRSYATTYIYVHHYDDEDWVVTFEAEQNGKRHRREVYVPEDLYSRCVVGEWFKVGSTVETQDHVVKHRVSSAECDS
jgi:hypothetical protein